MSVNRHDRRAAAARNRQRNNRFFRDYIQHLPRVPLNAPYGPGVHHVCIHHDPWCKFYETQRVTDCNCAPFITRHVEPVRQ